MQKEKVKFKRTSKRLRFDSLGLRLTDGDTAEVSKGLADHLFRHFAENFEKISIFQPFTKQGTPLAKLTSTPLVSILIPQRGRPTYIKRCLELILQNTSYPNYEVILICDRDDMDSVKEIPRDKRIKLVLDPSPTRRMFVGKINYGFGISKGDYLVYLANDVEVGKNWLTEAMKAMRGVFSDGTGLVAFNHGDPQKHAYHGLISRNFVNCCLNGNIFYPGYIHFWCDLELVAIAKKYKKFCFCATSKVSHNRPKDSLHAEAQEKSCKQGNELWKQRREMGFPYSRLKTSQISVLTIHYWPSEHLKKCLLSYLPKEVEFINLDNENNKNWKSGAAALNYGIRKAKNDVVICAHENIMFKKGWFEGFIEQESRIGNWGALGIVGKGIDRHLHWGSNHDAPYEVQTLDECCIIVNRKNNIWFDEKTLKGFHCYGADFCLQAQYKGLGVHVISGPATHVNAPGHSKDWKPKLLEAHNLLKKKWGKVFPTIYTSTGILNSPQNNSLKSLKIDIIMPTYNRPNLLQRAIKSVLQQTCPDWELWIYDDGSDCDIGSIIEKYKDERIHFFAGPKLTQEQRKGRGGAIARNILLRKSKNELVAYLDDDNYYWPEAVEGAIRCFKEHPERDIIFGKMTFSTPKTESIPRGRRQVRFFTQPVSDPLCKLDTSQVMHRRRCLETASWPEKTPKDVFEDGLFFRKLREKYTFYPASVWFVNFYLHDYGRNLLQKEGMYIKKREDQVNENLLVLTTAGTVKWLREAVDSLRDPLDVLVVDDATPSGEIADFCATKGLLFAIKPKPKGLTHSWNLAYQFFKDNGYDACILSNDDVRFPQGFSKGLLEGLKKFDLVGGLSNQPGHQPKQRLPVSLLAKASPEDIDEIQKELLKLFKDKPFEQLPYFNGFCFAFGKSIGRFTFSDNLLFNPENINVEQEADLCKRIQCSKGKVGMCKTSYVFHWKNVTLKNCGKGRSQLWR